MTSSLTINSISRKSVKSNANDVMTSNQNICQNNEHLNQNQQRGGSTKSPAVHGADLDFAQFQLPPQRQRGRRGRPHLAADVRALHLNSDEQQQRRQSATQRSDAAQQTADIALPGAQSADHGDANSAGSVGVDYFSQSADARRIQQSIGQHGAHGLPLRFTAVVE